MHTSHASTTTTTKKNRQPALIAAALGLAVAFAGSLVTVPADASSEPLMFCVGSQYGDEDFTAKHGGKLCEAQAEAGPVDSSALDGYSINIRESGVDGINYATTARPEGEPTDYEPRDLPAGYTVEWFVEEATADRTGYTNEKPFAAGSKVLMPWAQVSVDPRTVQRLNANTTSTQGFFAVHGKFYHEGKLVRESVKLRIIFVEVTQGTGANAKSHRSIVESEIAD
ncbi:hypothetical protein E0W80_09460 [Microbacterium sp. PI-1]|uniref:hypothetical protein n=1 Tax=unclassified Microbacterium TaxID=2609290 RepID=UPI00103F0671|nr:MULTISPECIES: hypothetical protein [unclassified Microbacterium]TCJ23777.1 hypothetical protein E0W80_09460 [Microbacterium sp. PI-1]UUE20085.1 hypothetical protein LRQ07_15000 [Microbacterium sp. J1-1]